MCAVNGVRGGGVQRVVDQRRFARARHAGDAGEQAHREISGDVFEVVATRTTDANHLVLRRIFVKLALEFQLFRFHGQEGVSFGWHVDAQRLR